MGEEEGMKKNGESEEGGNRMGWRGRGAERKRQKSISLYEEVLYVIVSYGGGLPTGRGGEAKEKRKREERTDGR